MTYHDKNRLQAHLDIKLTATQLAVAKELADRINAKTGEIQVSAKTLAEAIGRTEKTTEKALRELIELDIYSATRPYWRSSRIWRLNVACPDNCPELFPKASGKKSAHNSDSRLDQLAITSKSYPQANPITSKKSSITSNHYRTNRDINIDDIELQLSKCLITITELLTETGELTKNQAKLHNWLTKNPGSIEAKVRQLASHYKVKQLKPYLEAIIRNSPETLYKDLEQAIRTPKQVKREAKQIATIYSPGASTRITENRLAKYCQEIIGFTLTASSSSYLLKIGTAITWRDLQLAKQFEAIANSPEIVELNPNNPLQLELIDNQINISYKDLDSPSFNLDNLDLNAWQLLTAGELELYLEAGKLEKELRAKYEAQGKSWRTAESYGLELIELRSKYPAITPAEAGRRFTQAVSELLIKLHQATPEAPAEPELYPDIKTWLASNYTLEHDYQELLEHYPDKPESHTWNTNAGLNAYKEATEQGLTWQKLANAMDHYRESLGSSWPKAPNTWINEQIDRHIQDKARAERAGEARTLENILAGLDRP